MPWISCLVLPGLTFINENGSVILFGAIIIIQFLRTGVFSIAIHVCIYLCVSQKSLEINFVNRLYFKHVRSIVVYCTCYCYLLVC